MESELYKLLIGGILVFLGFFGKTLLEFITIWKDNKKKKFQAYSEKDAENYIKNLEKENNSLKEYAEKAENKDTSGITNTVIVAVGGSNDWNVANKTYYCQKGKEFRPGTEYIGFYANGIITGYGRKIKMNEQEINNLPLSETPIADRIKDHDFYRLDGFEPLKITWYDSSKGSNQTETPILSRRYIILDELLKKK